MPRLSLIPIFVLSSLLPLTAQPPQLPRPAPPLEVSMPNGSKLSLSKYAGKVCVVEFLFTTCPHCQESAKMFRGLMQQYAPQGLNVVGAAFNDNAMMLVPDFSKNFAADSFPIGVVPREKVFQFMNFSMMARISVPMFAVIDKKGQIRYQSALDGSDNLHSEPKMRQVIEELLKEPANGVSKKATGTSKKTD
jgi:peroxiredoxin